MQMMTAELLENLLIQCASEGRDISYSEALFAFGLRFTRPKMRELCKLLGTVDAAAESRSEPPLAVLVVRASDRLPGDGWWACRTSYRGEWTGEQARKYVHRKQRAAFKFWSAKAGC